MYNKRMNIKKHSVIVSVQAMKDEPFYNEAAITAMMQAVLDGGAQGLRVAGERDIKIAKSLTDSPVIGLTKPDILPSHPEKEVYITPTISDIKVTIEAGADIVAFDSTSRPRPDGSKLEDNIELIHKHNRLAMADISTLKEGIKVRKLGADIISTTLSGYTDYSQKTEGPDFGLLKGLSEALDCPIILEGRIWHPNEVHKAFELGAHAVVIGSAITRPHLITKRFTN